MKYLHILGAALGSALSIVGAASATNDCKLHVLNPTVLELKNNCTTDSTIVVPSGMTLVGGGRTITVIDPPGGWFTGPVVKLTGPTGGVKTTNITGNLQSACEDNDTNRLIGVLVDGVSATMDRVTVTINRGPGNTCNDGIGFEFRNSFPTDGSIPVPLVSTIKKSTVIGTQWIGIRLRGNVNVRVDSNKLTGDWLDAALAQRGVVLSEGASALVIKNTVLNYGRQSTKKDPGIGILLDGAAITTRLDTNTVQYGDIGIRLVNMAGGTVYGNKVTNFKRDGILLENGVSNASVQYNTAAKNRNGISVLGITTPTSVIPPAPFSTNNLLKYNILDRNTQYGIYAAGWKNKIQRCESHLSGVLDIVNFGSKMYYQYNVCDTSSGPPVDCGVKPVP